MPQVSIILPAYKHAQYIGQAIGSILAQSFAGWELIIVNDGSPDDTCDVVKPFLSDSRIQYLEQENQGQSAARNLGISLAQAEFIHLLDDDDWLPPDALEWQVYFLTKNREFSAIVGSTNYIDENGKHLSTSSISDGTISFHDLFSGNAFDSPGQALFRHDSLKSIGGFNATLRGVDDYDFMFRFTHLFKVRKANRVCLNYRCHSGNASRNKALMLTGGMAVAYKYLEYVEEIQLRHALRSKVNKALSHYAGPDIFKEYISNPLSLNSMKSLLVYFRCAPVATAVKEVLVFAFNLFRAYGFSLFNRNHKTI